MSLEFPFGWDPWQHHYGSGGGWGGSNPLMGGSPWLREAEAAHDRRVQNSFDSSRLQSAVQRGDAATAAAILRSNPDVGISVGGTQMYGEVAAGYVQQPGSLRPPATADEVAASRNNYNSAAVVKQELLNRMTTNAAGAADGMAVNVAVYSADTQWEVVQRGLRQMAAQAGLPADEQASFVAEWTARLQQTGETGLYNYAAELRGAVRAGQAGRLAALRGDGARPAEDVGGLAAACGGLQRSGDRQRAGERAEIAAGTSEQSSSTARRLGVVHRRSNSGRLQPQ